MPRLGLRLAPPSRKKLRPSARGESLQAFILVDVGPAHYGRELGGLRGIDFLKRAGAIVNLRDWTLEFTAAAVQSPQ